MKLKVLRQPSSTKSTQGSLYFTDPVAADIFFCFTLEPPSYAVARGIKPYAIPAGIEYAIKLLPSHHFDCITPHLVEVPGFEMVEIHWGNWPRDTEACLLVGMQRDVDVVYSSRAAFGTLMTGLLAAEQRGEALSIIYQDAGPGVML